MESNYATRTIRHPCVGSAPTITKHIVASMTQRAGPMPPASLAFIAALGSCIHASAHPHPVAARNVNLVPAWLGWTARQEGVDGKHCSPDQFVADPCYRFDECAKVIKRAISIDPVWQNMVYNARPQQEPDMGVDCKRSTNYSLVA